MTRETELLVIEKAIRNLETIGCKVGILDRYNVSYGGYKLVPMSDEKRKRAAPTYKRGTLSGYLEPFLSLLTDEGDVIDVPMSPLFGTKSKLNSSISAYMCNNYGNKSCRVENVEGSDFVRVFRLKGNK